MRSSLIYILKALLQGWLEMKQQKSFVFKSVRNMIWICKSLQSELYNRKLNSVFWMYLIRFYVCSIWYSVHLALPSILQRQQINHGIIFVCRFMYFKTRSFWEGIPFEYYEWGIGLMLNLYARLFGYWNTRQRTCSLLIMGENPAAQTKE
jgi:hypothetical protein